MIQTESGERPESHMTKALLNDFELDQLIDACEVFIEMGQSKTHLVSVSSWYDALCEIRRLRAEKK